MAEQLIPTIIFVVALTLIFTEKVNRTIVALTGAVVMILFGTYMGFYNQDMATEIIDFNTLGLLFGMMVLVALLEPTGFFQYLAVWVGKISKGKPVRLLVLLGAVTTIISMFLDNVTTVVLIAPVTILICEILGYNVQPFLISEALLSNTGGVSTLVGDPPNILIASAAGFTFNDFLVNSLPIVFFVWFVALFVVRIVFREELKPGENSNPDAVLNLNPKEVIKDMPGIIKSLVMVLLAVFGFVFEKVIHLAPSTVAITAASFALFWIRPGKLKETLNKVEWDILIFFGALFVMVGGLEHAGVLGLLADVIAQWTSLPPVVLGIILLWMVAILSAIVDNIPITIALIPVIAGLGDKGMDISHLWWALAFGAGFGGNGTIIGSTANVVVTSLSERTRHPITPLLWSKKGLPVMIVTCLVASGLYALFYYTIGF